MTATAIAMLMRRQESGALPVARPLWPFTKKRNTRALYRYAMIQTGASIGSLDISVIRTLTFRLRHVPGTYWPQAFPSSDSNP